MAWTEDPGSKVFCRESKVMKEGGYSGSFLRGDTATVD